MKTKKSILCSFIAVMFALIFTALSLTGCPMTDNGGGGNSGPSAPYAPTGLTATAVSDSRIDLYWSAVSGAAGYYVYASTSYSGPFTNLGAVTSNNAYNYNLPGSTTRYYKVTAFNSYGESGYSNVAYATTFSGGTGGGDGGGIGGGGGDTPGGGESAPGAPGVPTGVNAAVASSTSITVSWNSVSNATGYRVYRSTNSSTGYSQVGGNISGTTYTNTGLTANTTYYYRVAAYNSSGEGSQSSYASATTTLGNAPRTPTGVTALATADSPSSSISLGWKHSGSSSDSTRAYKIYRSTSADGYYTHVGTYEPRSGNLEDIYGYGCTDSAGLSAGTMYYYKISATTATGGEGAQSDYAYANTTAEAPPLYSSNVTSLSMASWSYNTFSGGQSEAWYSFTATQGTQYWIWCHDREGGNTFDARISAYYADAQGSTIFNGTDNSWSSGATFTASRNVTVYVRVYPYNYQYITGDRKTYGITYSTSSTRPN